MRYMVEGIECSVFVNAFERAPQSWSFNFVCDLVISHIIVGLHHSYFNLQLLHKHNEVDLKYMIK